MKSETQKAECSTDETQQAGDYLHESVRRESVKRMGAVTISRNGYIEELERENVKLCMENQNRKKALDYCLSCLKSHHMSRPGISTLVKRTEDFLSNVRDHRCSPEASATNTERDQTNE